MKPIDFKEQNVVFGNYNIEENKPHKVSEFICLNCKYRWIAVRPLQTRLKDLECRCCHQQGYVIETGETLNDFE